MAVAFRSASTAGAGTQGSPLAVTKPAGAVDNTDVYVLTFFTDSNGTVTPPSGFVERENTTFDANWHLIMYTKLAGTETTFSISWVGGNAYIDAILSCYSGCDASTATAHYVDSTANTGTGTTATGLGITLASADSMLVWSAISDVGARSGGPSGGIWTNRVTHDTNMYLDTAPHGSGATGNFTSTYSSQEWVVHVLGLQPAAAAGATSDPAGGAAARNVRRNAIYRMSAHSRIYVPASLAL